MKKGTDFYQWLLMQISDVGGRDDLILDLAYEVTKKGNRGRFMRLKTRDNWMWYASSDLRGALDVAWRAFQRIRLDTLDIQTRQCLSCDTSCFSALNGGREQKNFSKYADERAIGMVFLSPFDNTIRYACTRVATLAKEDLAKGDHSFIMRGLRECPQEYGKISALEWTVTDNARFPNCKSEIRGDIDFFLDYPTMPCRVRLSYPDEFELSGANLYVLVDRYTHESHRVKKILFSAPLPLAHTWFPPGTVTPPSEATKFVSHLRKLLSNQLATDLHRL